VRVAFFHLLDGPAEILRRREAVLRDHLAHFAAVLPADQRAGHPLFGARVFPFLTRQSEQERERIAFLVQETRGETL
jgi:hypothetical protein